MRIGTSTVGLRFGAVCHVTLKSREEVQAAHKALTDLRLPNMRVRLSEADHYPRLLQVVTGSDHFVSPEKALGDAKPYTGKDSFQALARQPVNA